MNTILRLGAILLCAAMALNGSPLIAAGLAAKGESEPEKVDPTVASGTDTVNVRCIRSPARIARVLRGPRGIRTALTLPSGARRAQDVFRPQEHSRRNGIGLPMRE